MGELQRIDTDLEPAEGDQDWIETLAKLGIKAIESSLAKHQEFEKYVAERAESGELPDSEQLEVG